MKITAWLCVLLMFVPLLPAQKMSGTAHTGGGVTFRISPFAPALYFAATLPQTWVNSGTTTGNGICSAPSGVYDVTKTLGTDYAATFAGLLAAANDWAAAPDQWWLVQVPHGTVLHGSTYDSNGALISFPTKAGATKCLVIQSDTPLTYQIPCAHGLPGFGGTRTPGCANDLSSMWTARADSTPTNGNTILYMGCNGTPCVGVNHIVVRDVELTVQAGSFQSANGVKVVQAMQMENGANNIALERFYVHGWNPGDSGQPAGACSVWNRSGTVTATGTATVTYASGNYFGPDFSDGVHSPGYPQATININGTNYTISAHDPAASNTVLTVNTSVPAGTWNYSLTNPATAYANGCGDDMRGVQLNCDTCWMEWGYIEKIHWFNSESHAISTGFSNGPYKIAHVWVEGGSCAYFSGGAPVDTRGGPANDGEIRGNYFGRDLAWRFLSAGAGKSPHPPFGCGPLDNTASHNTCPFNWAIKNNVEMKLGHRLLFDGNIIDGDWADGQSGYPILQTVRTCSGGATCGIYDPSTGLPLTAIDNIHFSNNWVRNSPQIFQISARSLGAGNGGGVSQPVQDLDYFNNLFTNVNDDNQFGSPGNDIFQWGGSGANTFLCTMTRASNIAEATCAPIKIGNLNNQFSSQPTVLDGGFDVSSVTRSGSSVTMKLNGNRHDPTVGQNVVIDVQDWLATTNFSNTKIKPSVGNPSNIVFSTGSNASTIKTGSSEPDWSICVTTCIDGGITWTNTGTTTIGYEGTFAIDGVLNGSSSTVCSTDLAGNSVTANVAVAPQPCIRSDGTFGDTITYNDNSNSGQCTSLSLCNQTGIRVLLPTLAYKITDLSVGDNVYAHDCSDSSYNTGSTSSTLATSDTTNPAGLTVSYSNPGVDDSSGATCQIDNNSGFPKNTAFQNNTLISLGIMSIQAGGQFKQNYNNRFYHNVFAMPSGNNAVLTCTGIGGQGTAVYACWDQATFQFFDNVLEARTSAQWSVVPSGSSVNTFPTDVTGIVTGLGAQPTDCVFDGTNVYNCPMMAAPWSSNFSLANLLSLSQGIDSTAFSTAMTQTEFICPTGASCGSHGPYPD